MAKLNINEEAFFNEVSALVLKGYSISNAIKKLMERPEYKFNFNQLRNLYYRLKKKEELSLTYSQEANTTSCKKDDTYYPDSTQESKGFLTSIKDFFRNLF